MSEIEKRLAEFAAALESNDEEAGKAAALALGMIALSSVVRIADALEHIARNLPTKPENVA
jgi:hypothetical protein